jgi:hypothetical protein
VVDHTLTQSPSSLFLRILYTHKTWYWCKTIVRCIISKANQTSFEWGTRASNKRLDFVVSKPYMIKTLIYNTTCKNYARITTCSRHIIKCKNDHSSEKQRRATTIELWRASHVERTQEFHNRKQKKRIRSKEELHQ